MQIALSTSYFAGRQDDPAVLCARIRALGFDAVEMGYYIPVERVPDWKSALAAEGLPVGSVHAFCPMEARFLRYGPEAWSIADPDDGARRTACMRLMQTLEATVGFGARAVVLHGGRVRMTERGLLFGSRPYRSKLSEAYRAHPGCIDEDLVRHEQELRSEGVPPLMDAVCRSLETVLPVFEEAGVALCFENLPGFEAFPDPAETAWLADRFRSPALGAWFDVGHAERKQRVGDWPVDATLEQTGVITRGAHIHDVRGLEEDHCAPGEGTVNFYALKSLLAQTDFIRVFEPSPAVRPEALRLGLEDLRQLLEGGG